MHLIFVLLRACTFLHTSTDYRFSILSQLVSMTFHDGGEMDALQSTEVFIFRR